MPAWWQPVIWPWLLIRPGVDSLCVHLDCCLSVCLSVRVCQDLLEDGGSLGTDASGNPILRDIGMYLKSEIKAHPPLKVGVICV